MNKKEASKLARKVAKLVGGITYKTRDSLSFDWIVEFKGESDELKEKVSQACKEVGLRPYYDKTNDTNSDYWGCHNSMIMYNGWQII